MIGLFDSGSGGLTVLRAMREVLPSADVLYFGDIKNAPYGPKSHEELSLLTIQAMKFLYDHGARSIVSACNSVSASLAISLFDSFDIEPAHLIEMVGPTVSSFRDSSHRVLLIATPATIHSSIYQNAFRMIGKNVRPLAIRGLAEAIECGVREEKIEQIIRDALKDTELTEFDVIVLACTHYPLVSHVFKRVVGDSVILFDPALAVAERIGHRLWPREVGGGKTHFVITKDSDVFRRQIVQVLGDMRYSIEVV